MAKSQTQEERQLLKLVNQLPVADEEKSTWLAQIQNGNMNEELADAIREKLAAPSDNNTLNTNRSRYLVDLANLVRRWRLSNQARNFGRH